MRTPRWIENVVMGGMALLLLGTGVALGIASCHGRPLSAGGDGAAANPGLASRLLTAREGDDALHAVGQPADDVFLRFGEPLARVTQTGWSYTEWLYDVDGGQTRHDWVLVLRVQNGRIVGSMEAP